MPAIRRFNSKWKKTAALLRNSSLRRYVPLTVPMTRRSLMSMLGRYRMVYIKPDVGTAGAGVIRIEKRRSAQGSYWFQAGTRARAFRTFDLMFAALLKIKVKRFYIVQKGIHLLKHRGRRFDLRVMVQKNPRRRWETTGIIGRLAHPRKIVTNYHSGGTPMAAGALLPSHLKPSGRKNLLARLTRVGLRTAAQMERAFPGMKELGLDIALDRKHHPWILEVNTRPDPYIFNRLRNKAMFRKIMHYARVYGRYAKRKRK